MSNILSKINLDGTDLNISDTNANIQINQILKHINKIATPESYGAVGDGTTDDYQAIQNAIDNNNIVIFDGNKTYLINSAIYISHSGCVLIGNGAKIKKGNGHTTALYIGTDTSDIYNAIVDNFELIGNSNLNNEFPVVRITITNSSSYIYNTILSNLIIHDTNGYGIGIYNDNGAPSSHLRATVSNCYFYKIAGVAIAQSKVETKIINNTFTESGAEAITLDNSSKNSIIACNTISGFKISGIGTDGGENNIIANNTINSNENLPGIVLNNNTGACTNCTITGNTIAYANPGIYVADCINTTISSNNCEGVTLSKEFTNNSSVKIFSSGTVNSSAISDSIFINGVDTDQRRSIKLSNANSTFTGKCYYKNGIAYIYGDATVSNGSNDIVNLVNTPWNISNDIQYDNPISEDDKVRIGSVTFSGNNIKAYVKTSTTAYIPINVALNIK